MGYIVDHARFCARTYPGNETAFLRSHRSVRSGHLTVRLFMRSSGKFMRSAQPLLRSAFERF